MLVSFAAIKILFVWKHYINIFTLSTDLENGNNEVVEKRIKFICNTFLHC
jgi:hypothetical protein